MSFPTIDELTTLTQAREAFSALLAAHETALSDKDTVTAALRNVQDEAEALRDDLGAANEMLDEASKEKQTLTGSIEDLNKQLAQAGTDLEAKVIELSEALERAGQLESRVAQLQSEAKAAEAKAAEICASVGVEPVAVTPSAETAPVSLLEQMRAIDNPAAQMAFFRKHREAILRGA